MPIIVVILGIVIVIMGAVFFMVGPKEEVPAPAPLPEANRTESMEVTEEAVVSTADPVPSQNEVSQNDPVAENTSTQVFTGTGKYITPARTNHEIRVSLTLAEGVVTEASVSYDDGDGFSNPNQERFDGAYKTEVIGKSLSEISLSRVGGASLTSEAFNQAVKEIQSQQS